MLDRFLNRLISWSPLRFWAYAILGAVVAMEMASWITSRITPCIVKSANYGEQYAKNNECPTLHVFFFKSAASVLEAVGHEWLIAIAAIATAFFTATLWRATSGMLRVTNASLKLARDEFLSTHRPKIRVKNVWLIEPIAAQKVIAVDVLFVNIGNGTAIIHTFGIDFSVVDNAVGILPGNLEPPIVEGFSGSTCGLGFTIRVEGIRSKTPLDENTVSAIMNGQRMLCCFGKVEYFDSGPPETRRIRRTSFYRVFKPFPRASDGMGRFIKSEKSDPDYEYED